MGFVSGILVAARLFTGGILLIAGYRKVRNPDPSLAFLSAIGIPERHTRASLVLVIGTEIVARLFVLGGFVGWLAWAARFSEKVPLWSYGLFLLAAVDVILLLHPMTSRYVLDKAKPATPVAMS